MISTSTNIWIIKLSYNFIQRKTHFKFIVKDHLLLKSMLFHQGTKVLRKIGGNHNRPNELEELAF